MKEKIININDMLLLAEKLHKKNKDKWGPATPESNTFLLTWLVAEVGEVIDIIKKKGQNQVMSNQKVRRQFLMEIADCYIYLADILSRYKVSAAEFSQIYQKKMVYNLKRNYQDKIDEELK